MEFIVCRLPCRSLLEYNQATHRGNDADSPASASHAPRRVPYPNSFNNGIQDTAHHASVSSVVPSHSLYSKYSSCHISMGVPSTNSTESWEMCTRIK
jgi:hypothetical protein